MGVLVYSLLSYFFCIVLYKFVGKVFKVVVDWYSDAFFICLILEAFEQNFNSY